MFCLVIKEESTATSIIKSDIKEQQQQKRWTSSERPKGLSFMASVGYLYCLQMR